ncbi:MAG: BadF/BadG/BcrA/BcrD ATPase family protein [Meiothermus sp.]|nr:BadF/BadG/BcrA/BcrD ATPase family protein [Meiothermus sp.]
MEVVAGIDGGGTKTLVALCTPEGRVLGLGRGGPSNVDDVGIATATQSIGAALDAACTEAKVGLEVLSSTFFGMAGVVSEEDRAIVQGIAQNLGLSGQSGIDHDCRIALAGALSGRPGIVLIAGTGSSCFGRNQQGEVWRSGGWGYLVSDEGSSYWLGREALVRVVRAVDGRDPPTALQPRLLEVLRVNHTDRLLHRLYVEGLSRSELAALAPQVIAAADEGDTAASQLLNQGGRLLVECVAAVAQQLELSDSELAVVGGLTKAGAAFWQPFKTALSEQLPQIRLTEAELPPVLGAVVCALEAQQKLNTTNLHALKNAAVEHAERL